LRCSNVANLIEAALQALALNDLEHVRVALRTALELSTGPQRR